MKFRTALLAAAAAAAASSASAAVIQLNFEGIAPHPNGNDVFIQNFYNGGTSSIGTSGTNFGISFGDNALLICLNTLTETCSNTSRGGQAPGTDKGSLFFLTGSQTYMNVAAGFETGFSFNYVSLNTTGSVDVYDGLNGTGNLLASVSLTPNAGSCPGYGAQFCPYGPAGVAFNGVAKSVSFGGVANQIVFDDITFGSVTPNVPEPETYALMALGLGMVALASRRRRQQAA